MWVYLLHVCVCVFEGLPSLADGEKYVFLELRDHRRNETDTAVFPNIPVDNLTSQKLQGLGTQRGREREREREKQGRS